MFDKFKQEMAEARERGEQKRKERNERAKEKMKESKEKRKEARENMKKARLGGGSIVNSFKEASKRAQERSDRALTLLEEFRAFEYEPTGDEHPQRYEYETHLVESDFLARHEDFLNFRAEDGWQLVRTFTKDDLGVESIGPAEMYMVFERPVEREPLE